MTTRRLGTSRAAPVSPQLLAMPAVLRRSGEVLRRLGLWKAVSLITAAAAASSLGLVLVSNTVMSPPARFVAFSLILSVLIPMLVAPPVAWLVMRLMLEADDARRTAERLAVMDTLTLAFNRRHFFEVGAQALARAHADGIGLSILLLDIDHFKRVNDEHGHAAGDAVLKNVARACIDNLREHQLFARFGGEEFAVLLPHTGFAEAERVAERLRLAVEALTTPAGSSVAISVTVSVGAAATTTSASASLDGLLARADEAMYAAKRGGRNRVIVAA